MIANTSGPAQLRHKTINVEANLLNEWLEERSRLLDQTRKMAAALAVVLVVALGTTPMIFSGSNSIQTASATTAEELAMLQASVEQLDKKRDKVKSKIDSEAMRASVLSRSRSFLGNGIVVMNSASSGMAIETLSLDVLGGDLTIRCKAQAERSTVTEDFLAAAGKGNSVVSTLLATSQKDSRLGSDGVIFEYVKRVEVGK